MIELSEKIKAIFNNLDEINEHCDSYESMMNIFSAYLE